MKLKKFDCAVAVGVAMYLIKDVSGLGRPKLEWDPFNESGLE